MSTKKYRVVRPHTLGFKVGEIVELTDEKARALVNKVELAEPELKAPAETKPKAPTKKASS